MTSQPENPILEELRAAKTASLPTGPLAAFHAITDAEIKELADALSAQGFRSAKKIAYGTEALVLEIGEEQALRYVIPHANHIQRERAQKSMIYQPVTPYVDVPSGFYQVFYKEPFEEFDSYNTPPDDPKWVPVKKAQAALANEGLVFVDYSAANFLNMKTHVGDRMLIGDPGNDVYSECMDDMFFGLMKPAIMEDFDEHYSYVDARGVWYQKHRYPNIITGQSFDAEYPGTGKVAGVLSNAQVAQMRGGAPVEILRADGSVFVPRLNGQPLRGQKKEEFLARVEGSFIGKDGNMADVALYPLQACKIMGIEVPPLKDGPMQAPDKFIKKPSSEGVTLA